LFIALQLHEYNASRRLESFDILRWRIDGRFRYRSTNAKRVKAVKVFFVYFLSDRITLIWMLYERWSRHIACRRPVLHHENVFRYMTSECRLCFWSHINVLKCACVAFFYETPAQSYGVSRDMRSPSVTCHLTYCTHPVLTPARQSGT